MNEYKLYYPNFQLQWFCEYIEKHDLELRDKLIKSVKFRFTPLMILVSQKLLTSNEIQIDVEIDKNEGDSTLEAILTELGYKRENFLSCSFASKCHNDKSNNGIYYSTSIASRIIQIQNSLIYYEIYVEYTVNILLTMIILQHLVDCQGR